MSRNALWASALIIPLAAGVALVPLRAQPPRGGRPNSVAANTSGNAATSALTNEVKIEVRDGFRYITSNGIPDHTPGQFPNRNNPNRIAPQSYRYRVPMEPKAAANPTRAGGSPFGVAVNGVPFDPGTAELWNNDFRWHYEALSGYFGGRGGLGVDDSLAHVQPNGAYHYHGLPVAFLKQRNYEKQMVLVGYAADGFPIYSPYAYSDPNDPKSGLKKLTSGYRVRSGNRPGTDGPGGAYDGSFAQDFEFVKGGDLDELNGRTGVTPEYPKGTYYYVLTETFPFVPRAYRGTPDASFQRRGPGGGPGGPGGQGFGGPGGPGGQGPGGPGFGGPGGQGGPGGFGGPGGQQGPGFGPPPGGGIPEGFVPGTVLPEYLALTEEQKGKLTRLQAVIMALRTENFDLREFPGLKLTDAQMRQVADRKPLRSVLTKAQIQFLEAHPRPRPGGPGGPGGQGFGGPGGPGGQGGPGGPDGFPPPPQFPPVGGPDGPPEQG